MTSSEQQITIADSAATVPAKKPRRAPQRTKAVPPKAAAGRKSPGQGKSASTRPMKKVRSVRKGTKTAKILTLLERPGGVSVKEIMKATGWQPHSVRGFLSGVVSKQMGLRLRTTADDSGTLRYAVKS